MAANGDAEFCDSHDLWCGVDTTYSLNLSSQGRLVKGKTAPIWGKMESTLIGFGNYSDRENVCVCASVKWYSGLLCFFHRLIQYNKI